MEYRSIPWPEREQPSDLEAITAVPGRPRHFAALTSKGRLYTVAIDAGGVAAEPVEGMPRVDRFIDAALLLAYACLRSGDRTGLFAFACFVRFVFQS